MPMKGEKRFEAGEVRSCEKQQAIIALPSYFCAVYYHEVTFRRF